MSRRQGLYRPWSLRELVAELSTGRTTPDAAAARAQRRIAETDGELRAWVVQAEVPDLAVSGPPGGPASGLLGPLGGVPLAVKDIIDLAGLPTRCGSPLRADAPPATADAAIVQAWRTAGAVPIGKTVTTEFAYFQPGPTHNPAAPGHTPGGSSSGSAAAVAAGQVPLALGSQTAGSVTRPASFCGVAALVMSHGRFPVTGVAGLSPALDSHGVFTATASDLALAWSALTGEPDAGPRRPRLLLWSGEEQTEMAPAMREGLRTVVDRMRAAGAVVDVFPGEPLVAQVAAAHPVVMAYEAARERAAELARADRLSAPLATLLRTGAATPDSDYEAARLVVAAAESDVRAWTEGYDAVIGPATPGPAPEGLGATGDPVLSRGWQALGLPVVAVPGLRDEQGLPLGLQLVGRAGGETALLAAARWVEDVVCGITA
ncbi:amidase [Lentzea sp. HUAS TT2]|uniref:amidase n=1 Tax=Lentzea sp. HUAS TT2 TaxID=3447454 RepID=UPI003F6FD2DE